MGLAASCIRTHSLLLEYMKEPFFSFLFPFWRKQQHFLNGKQTTPEIYEKNA